MKQTMYGIDQFEPFCDGCQRKKLETHPFFYTCTDFLCGECYCAPCFRKRNPSINEQNLEWKLFYEDESTDEIAFLFLTGVNVGVCFSGH